MGYRRGFKSEANATAREIRAELGLKDLDRLDPWALAAHLRVPMHPAVRLRSGRPTSRALLHRRSTKARSRRVPSSTATGAPSSTMTHTRLIGRRATWPTN